MVRKNLGVLVIPYFEFVFDHQSFYFVVSVVAEYESEFDYNENSPRGPARWGEIHPEWSACSNGSMQSPIDMSNERVNIVSHLGRLKRSYKPSNATLKNRGHDMMVMKNL